MTLAPASSAAVQPLAQALHRLHPALHQCVQRSDIRGAVAILRASPPAVLGVTDLLLALTEAQAQAEAPTLQALVAVCTLYSDCLLTWLAVNATR